MNHLSITVYQRLTSANQISRRALPAAPAAKLKLSQRPVGEETKNHQDTINAILSSSLNEDMLSSSDETAAAPSKAVIGQIIF